MAKQTGDESSEVHLLQHLTSEGILFWTPLFSFDCSVFDGSILHEKFIGRKMAFFNLSLLLTKLILVIGCKKSHFTRFYFCNYEDKMCQDQEDWTDLNIREAVIKKIFPR